MGLLKLFKKSTTDSEAILDVDAIKNLVTEASESMSARCRDIENSNRARPHNCDRCKYRCCKRVNNNTYIDYCEISKQIFTSAVDAQNLDFQSNRNKYPEDDSCRYWEYGDSSTWGDVIGVSNSAWRFMCLVDAPEDIPGKYKDNPSTPPRVGHYFIDNRNYKFYIITSTDPLVWAEMVSSSGSTILDGGLTSASGA